MPRPLKPRLLKPRPLDPEALPLPATISRRALLADGSDREFRALIHDLMAYSRRIGDCRDAFAAILDVSGMQYEVLMLVSRFGAQGLAVGEVATRLHRSAAFITIESGKLADRGVLEKFGDPRDGRSVRLRATRKGGDLVRRIAPVQRQVNDALFECVDARRFRQLRRLAAELVVCGDRGAALAEFLSRTSAREAA